MGTPEIAAVMLRALVKGEEVVGVFCQPDKPVGRKQILTPPAVKVAATELGIPVYQPVKLRDGDAERIIKEMNPELIVVVAYGRLLPKEILDIPPLGCVNIHASLLPKYRGSAPIQRALLNAETVSGVTAMYMEQEMDTGDIIDVSTVDIAPDDNATSLFDKMGKVGAELIVKTVKAIKLGTATRTKQIDADASFAPPLTKEEGLFSFEDDAKAIHSKVRAFEMWPNAYFLFGDKKIKVLRSAVDEGEGKAGKILSLNPLRVATKKGVIVLLEVKPEGSRLMSGKEWAMGTRFKSGDIL